MNISLINSFFPSLLISVPDQGINNIFLDTIILSVIYLFANVVEVVAGFGSTIVSISLGANIYPLDKLLFALLPLNIVLSAYIVIKHKKFLDFKLLIKEILPFMGFGFLLGVYILSIYSLNSLKNIYGILILILGIRGLYVNIKNTENSEKKISNSISSLFIFLSGIVHGLYASGGPLLVYGLNSKNLDKDSFRVNLSTVWLFFNIALFIFYLATNKVNISNLSLSVYLIPSLILGILIGEKIHYRINERIFRILVFTILSLAGISLSLAK